MWKDALNNVCFRALRCAAPSVVTAAIALAQFPISEESSHSGPVEDAAVGARPQPERIEFNGVPAVRAVDNSSATRVIAPAVQDFDRGNGPDIATIQTDGTLYVRFNDGSGKLDHPYSNHSAAALSAAITLLDSGDLNGDGNVDLAALDSRNSMVLVFLNNGNRTFSTAVQIPVSSSATASLAGGGFAIADANGDRKPDLVTVARSTNAGATVLTQQTFLNAGNGTFQPSPQVTMPLPGVFSLDVGRSISIADLNRDGKIDLVLQLYQAAPVQGIRPVTSLGNGDGTFQPIAVIGSPVNAGPQPASSLVLADVNGDSEPDAVFLSYSDKVYVALGQPDGSFEQPRTVLSNISGAVLLTLADLNKDGAQDLVVFGSGQLGIFHGSGDGSFRSAGQYTGGYGIYQQPAPADFNADGNLDIAWLDYTNGRTALYSGKPDGTFAAASPIPSSDPTDQYWAGNSQVIAMADLNADGKQDILTYRWPHAAAGGSADLYAGFGDGAGKFAFTLALPASTLRALGERYRAFSIDANLVDLNHDRRPDLILRTQSGMSVLPANGDGTFSSEPIDLSFPLAVGCMPFSFLTTADVNGDGAKDIVASYSQNQNCPVSSGTPSGFFVMKGDGTGHFQAQFTPVGSPLYFVRLADFNNDGKIDMAVAAGNSGNGLNLVIAPGNGDGTFRMESASMPVRGTFISNILATDYNRDGWQDLVVSTAGTANGGAAEPGTQALLTLQGYGDFAFGEPQTLLAGVRSDENGVVAGDFNCDGKPDLAASSYAKANPYEGSYGLIVLPGTGRGTFGKPKSELAAVTVTSRNPAAYVSDFDQDGAPDVLLGNGLSSPLFLNKSKACSPRGVTFPISGLPQSVDSEPEALATTMLGHSRISLSKRH